MPFSPTISYWAASAATASTPSFTASTKTRCSAAVTFVFHGFIWPLSKYVTSNSRFALGTVTSNLATYSTPEGERNTVPFFSFSGLSGFSFLTRIPPPARFTLSSSTS
ncbi:hypothetical protein SCYAM73S_04557 [Streptomyces cyaneofuscatus]